MSARDTNDDKRDARGRVQEFSPQDHARHSCKTIQTVLLRRHDDGAVGGARPATTGRSAASGLG
jgi:hypothetical protein